MGMTTKLIITSAITTILNLKCTITPDHDENVILPPDTFQYQTPTLKGIWANAVEFQVKQEVCYRDVVVYVM